MSSTMPPYPPIADYAAIGCTRSVALISRAGSIDWLCWPRFDSASVFGRILDAEKGGFFAIRPSIEHEAKRCYLDGTNVIETTFTTETGVARMLDLMPVFTEEEKQKSLSPFRQLLRRIEVIEGEVPIEIVYAPRPDYGRITPRLEVRRDSVCCSWGARALNLRSDCELAVDQGAATSRVTLHAGESRTFALGFDDATLHGPSRRSTTAVSPMRGRPFSTGFSTRRASPSRICRCFTTSSARRM